MTTTTLARRTATTVAPAEPTRPQVRRALPLSTALAIVSAVVAVLAAWSEFFAGRTGQAQLLAGMFAVVALAAGYERIREHRR